MILGLVYGYIPFFILPLYAGARSPRLPPDRGGAGPRGVARSAFLRVTLPMSMPGILAASVITALPMFGDYYTNTILSGSPRTTMIGNQIESHHPSPQPQKGAVLVLVLSALLLVLMAYYLVITTRAQRDAG